VREAILGSFCGGVVGAAGANGCGEEQTGIPLDENAITVVIVGTLIDTSELTGVESPSFRDNGFSRSDEFQKTSRKCF
jgi:hypothetical protein